MRAAQNMCVFQRLEKFLIDRCEVHKIDREYFNLGNQTLKERLVNHQLQIAFDIWEELNDYLTGLFLAIYEDSPAALLKTRDYPYDASDCINLSSDENIVVEVDKTLNISRAAWDTRICTDKDKGKIGKSATEPDFIKRAKRVFIGIMHNAGHTWHTTWQNNSCCTA